MTAVPSIIVNYQSNEYQDYSGYKISKNNLGESCLLLE